MKRNLCKTCGEASVIKRRPRRTIAMFVGLSSKPGTEALCPSTNTGLLVGEIEQRVADALCVYRTNLVKCAPTDANGKLRYPTAAEMENCFPKLLAEIQHLRPRIIVPLGAQVAKFMVGRMASARMFEGFADDFQYQAFPLEHHILLPVHHPSYIWIYRRKHVSRYVEAVGNLMLKMAR